MTRPSRTLSPAAAAALAALALLAAPASASAGQAVSSNWGGYVSLTSAPGSRFAGVSGTWQVPTASCTAGHETYAAVWAGLGGYSERADALEQVGTDADCSHSGHAVYDAWYELIPAAPVVLKLHVRPGDEVTAAVTIRGHGVTLGIRDLTTGARRAITRRVSELDAGSAEWIVEAPSVCASEASCQTLPLSDFGTVTFASASATLAGHTGAIDDAAWSTMGLQLRQPTSTASGDGRPTKAVVTATPSTLANSVFSVSWSEQSVSGEQPTAPTLPGFGGGS